jgi:hypothetical protein
LLIPLPDSFWNWILVIHMFPLNAVYSKRHSLATPFKVHFFHYCLVQYGANHQHSTFPTRNFVVYLLTVYLSLLEYKN